MGYTHFDPLIVFLFDYIVILDFLVWRFGRTAGTGEFMMRGAACLLLLLRL